MRRIGSFALVAAVVWAAIVAGCAPLHVRAYVPPGADLRQYRTYAWDATDRLVTGDARLDNNTMFAERVQSAVERHLREKGLEKVTSGADLVVHYHASITQRLTVGARPSEGQCPAGACGPDVYDVGTLLVDLVDAHSNRLAWRGWAEGSLEGVIDDQAALDARVDDAVARILARLPL